MHDYARHLVASTAAQVLPATSPIKNVIARQFLPYCVCLRPDGRYILLNREYKPLGWPTRLAGFVDYDRPEFESMMVDPPVDFLRAATSTTSDRGTFFYLYGKVDGCDPPWTSPEAAKRYLYKLGVLLDAERMTREGCQP